MPFKSQAQRRKFAQLLSRGRSRIRPSRNGTGRPGEEAARAHWSEGKGVKEGKVATQTASREDEDTSTGASFRMTREQRARQAPSGGGRRERLAKDRLVQGLGERGHRDDRIRRCRPVRTASLAQVPADRSPTSSRSVPPGWISLAHYLRAKRALNRETDLERQNAPPPFQKAAVAFALHESQWRYQWLDPKR